MLLIGIENADKTDCEETEQTESLASRQNGCGVGAQSEPMGQQPELATLRLQIVDCLNYISVRA